MVDQEANMGLRIEHNMFVGKSLVLGEMPSE